MSQDELAQKLNVSRQSVSLWENGLSQPTIENVIALTRIFGISSDELLGNSDTAREDPASKAGSSDLTPDKKKKRTPRIIGGMIAAAVVLAIVFAIILGPGRAEESLISADTPSDQAMQAEVRPQDDESPAEVSSDAADPAVPQAAETENAADPSPDAAPQDTAQPQSDKNTAEPPLDGAATERTA